MGKVFLENILYIIGFCTAAFVLIKVLKDYQDRKLAETTIKAKETSVGAEAIKEIREMLKRVEQKVQDVDDHCDKRNIEQNDRINDFFRQTWNILNKH